MWYVSVLAEKNLPSNNENVNAGFLERVADPLVILQKKSNSQENNLSESNEKQTV